MVHSGEFLHLIMNSCPLLSVSSCFYNSSKTLEPYWGRQVAINLISYLTTPFMLYDSAALDIAFKFCRKLSFAQVWIYLELSGSHQTGQNVIYKSYSGPLADLFPPNPKNAIEYCSDSRNLMPQAIDLGNNFLSCVI